MINKPFKLTTSKGVTKLVRQTGTAAPPLRAVIFDCDGILVDTEPLHYRALQKVLAPLGLGHDFKR